MRKTTGPEPEWDEERRRSVTVNIKKGSLLDDAEVDFLMEAAAAEAPAQTQAAHDPLTVTMRGDLEQINLADIFQTLAMSKMEGVLRVRNPIEERQVYCNNGAVRILVPSRIALRRLGQRLVQAGLIQPEQLRSTLLLQRKEKLPLGQLLVQEGLLEQEQIDAVAGMQVAEDLFSLFTWRHGTFEFYKGELTDPAQRASFETCPEFEVNSLLLEVARRSDEWQMILEAIRSLDEVPLRIADPADESALNDSHRTVLLSADGRVTYREIADQTTVSLFEMARAARDLARGGLIANVDDPSMLDLATHHAKDGQEKRALLLLQTLRDRPGTRDVETLRGMAAAIEQAGEKRLAGMLLLEAAQMQDDPKVALQLARRARELSPNDTGTVSFLRTILIAHGGAESSELEKVTLDLLDSLIEADLTSTALEIVADARATGSVKPQILVREARARQKARDPQGAADAMMELAELYIAQKDRVRAAETCQAILRLDRSRKDVQKLLTQLRQTKLGRVVRSVALALAIIMLGGMAFAFWQQHRFDSAVAATNALVDDLLSKGDVAGSREQFEALHKRFGDCEPVDDLQRRVNFAESANRTRTNKAARQRLVADLSKAAEQLNKGDLRAALEVYNRIVNTSPTGEEIDGTVAARIDALLERIEQTAKALPFQIPPEPTVALDRRELNQRLDDLQRACPTEIHVALGQLESMRAADVWPPQLVRVRERITTLLRDSRNTFATALARRMSLEEALQRTEHERRLDPMFKEAVAKEQALDFPGALELYRKLNASQAGDEQLRSHFREQITRNETICQGLAAAQAATEAGDFAAAQTAYRGLRKAFPELPFDRMVQLPLKIDSQPQGATLQINGKAIGSTPYLHTFLPAEQTTLQVILDGFTPDAVTISGDELGAWTGYLRLEPTFRRLCESMIEVAPISDDLGQLLLVDRSGAVTAIGRRDGRERWVYRTGDLSGLLSQPFLAGPYVVVASLDGELRAIDRRSGSLAWSLPDLPTEVPPALVGNTLAIVTTAGTLYAIDLTTRAEIHVNLGQADRHRLLAHGRTLVTITENGNVQAHTLPELAPLWQQKLPALGFAQCLANGSNLHLVSDRGVVQTLDLSTGEPRWHLELDREVLGGPTLTGGALWVVSPDQITRIDPASGKVVDCQLARGGDWASGPIPTGERAMIQLRSGAVQVLDDSARALYRLEGTKRGAVLSSPDGAFVMLADRTLQWFASLR